MLAARRETDVSIEGRRLDDLFSSSDRASIAMVTPTQSGGQSPV